MTASSLPRTETSAGTCRHQPRIDQLRRRLNAALVGKADVMEQVLACLLARGHLLFEDLPGLGKTTLAKAISDAIGGAFARIQCTPDLMPTDITGFNVFDQRTREFEFRRGPVFAEVLLADEINRATPRTQSALFEAMAERQVTVDGSPHPLARGFFVIATQNPVESHGAFPLPEAQLDRFAMKLAIGYPDRDAELELLARHVGERPPLERSTEPVMSMAELDELQQHVESVAVSDAIKGYLIDLAGATRRRATIRIGLSPRGLLIWTRVAQALAHLRGRDFVVPEDVQDTALSVLGVRLSGDFDDPRREIDSLLASVPVPVPGVRR
ncbi:MAG TPA: magnesium chelatase [Planctomycetaceae bacterium]|nr:magnesium chelatase [Planctomycetaceae bacterium]HRF01635.1 MoxR family ATPase [Pirellulaceae bacterium]